MIPQPVSAVLFDMDGLLFDTERIYLAAMIEAARDMGRDMSHEFARSMVGVPTQESIVMIRDHFGPQLSLEAYQQAYVIRRDAILVNGVPLKPGTLELLNWLDSADLPKAIATTSSRRTADRYLNDSGLHGRFDALVTHEDVLRHKPFPDPFIKAAERLGVSPSACVVLEDSYHGIRAAHAAGAMPIMVPDLLEVTDEMNALCVAVAKNLHVARRLLVTSMGSRD